MFHLRIAPEALAGRRSATGRVALAALMAGGLLSAPLQAAHAEPIAAAHLGAVFSLTGPFAIYSRTIRNALKMATAKANSQGGPKLDIDLENDHSTKNGSINVYQQFIHRDNDLLIFGPLTGGQVYAAAPLAQRAHVPVMLTSVATPGVTGIGNYIFKTSVNAATLIPPVAKIAAQKFGIKKVAQIYANNDQFSIGEFKAFRKALKANGIKVVDTETVRTGQVNFSAQLTKIKSLHPGAIVISCQGQQAVGIMTQAREMGMDKVRFLGGVAFNTAGVLKAAGQAMDGALSATPWFAGMDNAKNQNFVAKYRSEFKSKPDYLAAQTYDAVLLVKKALVKAHISKNDNVTTARKKLRNALAKIKSFDGVMGKIRFTATRKPIVAGAVTIVKDGKRVLVSR